MTYYLCFVQDALGNTAATKAPSDIYRICEKRGFTKYTVPAYYAKHGWFIELIYGGIQYMYYWMKLFLRIRRNDIIIFQHPSPGSPIMGIFLSLCKWRACKVIALIHDLETLRHGVDGKASIERNLFKDGSILKRADVVICHNDMMRKYLLQKGFNDNQVISLELFDYLTYEKITNKKRTKSMEIVIAGNLTPNKSEYIYKIKSDKNQKLKVFLYGVNFDAERADKDSLVYCGAYSAEILPSKLQGSFGLVWDGNSTSTCAGNTGEYLRYNNPHKLSLYVAAGLPVIAWKQAAVAEFVLKKGIGLVIDNLDDIEEVISSVSDDQYRSMCTHIDNLSEKVREGWYFQDALDRALKII